jgi:hypothetical protein
MAGVPNPGQVLGAGVVKFIAPQPLVIVKRERPNQLIIEIYLIYKKSLIDRNQGSGRLLVN